MADLISPRCVFQNNSIERRKAIRGYTEKFPPLPPNYILWLRGSNVEINTSNKVHEWTDLSENNYSPIQTTEVKKPLYVPNALNGWPVVRLDGVDDIMSKGFDKTFPQPNTGFVVWNITGSAGVRQYPINFLWNFYWINTNNIMLDAGGAHQTVYAKAAPFGFIITSAEINGATSRIYENGVLKNTVNAGSTYGAQQVDIGGVTWDSRFLKGDVAEVIVYPSLLSAANRQSVENYLKVKYAL